eukprot:1893632-Rhodomonas_salina.2
MVLRACYETSGTELAYELAYGGTCISSALLAFCATPGPVLSKGACYAMSGTERGYHARRALCDVRYWARV